MLAHRPTQASPKDRLLGQWQHQGRRPLRRRAAPVQATGSTFGHSFRVTTFGESHGGAVGCVIDGVPPRLRITKVNSGKPPPMPPPRTAAPPAAAGPLPLYSCVCSHRQLTATLVCPGGDPVRAGSAPSRPEQDHHATQGERHMRATEWHGAGRHHDAGHAHLRGSAQQGPAERGLQRDGASIPPLARRCGMGCGNGSEELSRPVWLPLRSSLDCHLRLQMPPTTSSMASAPWRVAGARRHAKPSDAWRRVPWRRSCFSRWTGCCVSAGFKGKKG